MSDANDLRGLSWFAAVYSPRHPAERRKFLDQEFEHHRGGRPSLFDALNRQIQHNPRAAEVMSCRKHVIFWLVHWTKNFNKQATLQQLPQELASNIRPECFPKFHNGSSLPTAVDMVSKIYEEIRNCKHDPINYIQGILILGKRPTVNEKLKRNGLLLALSTIFSQADWYFRDDVTPRDISSNDSAIIRNIAAISDVRSAAIRVFSERPGLMAQCSLHGERLSPLLNEVITEVQTNRAAYFLSENNVVALIEQGSQYISNRHQDVHHATSEGQARIASAFDTIVGCVDAIIGCNSVRITDTPVQKLADAYAAHANAHSINLKQLNLPHLAYYAEATKNGRLQFEAGLYEELAQAHTCSDSATSWTGGPAEEEEVLEA